MKNYFLILNLCALQCLSQSSSLYMDYNNVKSLLTDQGILFNNMPISNPGYEVPKGSGHHAIFSAGFWVGGLDELGVLKLAASTYYEGDFFSGPYSTNNSYLDPIYLQKYDNAIWEVYRWEIENHIANYSTPGYVMPQSILNWPGNGDNTLGVVTNLAPFIDINGDNVYNPAEGDYPDIRGDQAAYIILNDAKGPHTSSTGDPLNIELHIMAYNFGSNDYLNNTTFLNVRIFNRGNYSFSNLKFGLFLDADIGFYGDDYAGSLQEKDLMYFYNGDNNDANPGDLNVYGTNPPCIGLVSLTKPVEACGIYTSLTSYPYVDPNSSLQYWNFLNAKWSDSSPWTYGGLGNPNSTGGSLVPTNFIFEGNPYDSTGWTEFTNNHTAGDRRGVFVNESSPLNPNEESCYEMAVLFSNSGNNLENVQNVIQLSDSVKQFYLDQETFNCNQVTAGINEISANEFSIYPNPTTGKVVIESSSDYQLSIYDFHGRLVKSVSKQSFEKSLEVILNQGVYLFEFETISGKTASKVIVTD